MLESLVARLKSAKPFVRGRTAKKMRNLGPEASELAVPALVEALRVEKDHSASGEIHDAIVAFAPEVVPLLFRALCNEKEDSNVRACAAFALASIAPIRVDAPPREALIAALTKLLGSHAWVLRSSALLGLERIRPTAVEAVPALIAAGSVERDDFLRKEIAKVRCAITGALN